MSEVWDVPDNEAVVAVADVGEVPLPTTMLTYKIRVRFRGNQATFLMMMANFGLPYFIP